jgi:hypothetical protein
VERPAIDKRRIGLCCKDKGALRVLFGGEGSAVKPNPAAGLVSYTGKRQPEIGVATDIQREMDAPQWCRSKGLRFQVQFEIRGCTGQSIELEDGPAKSKQKASASSLMGPWPQAHWPGGEPTGCPLPKKKSEPAFRGRLSTCLHRLLPEFFKLGIE